MTIKAKFRCNYFTERNFGAQVTQREFNFMAVYGKEGENATYSKATPSGQLTIVVDKDTAAFDSWKPGKEYYLTFEEV